MVNLGCPDRPLNPTLAILRPDQFSAEKGGLHGKAKIQ
jgi:hypothetical protein